MKNIVETAVVAGSFGTLVEAVKAAGLVDTLSGPGPFTVFAPSDDAFSKLPAGTVEKLLEDKDKLTAVLTYHVASGNHSAAEIATKSSILTLQGGELNVDTQDGVMVGPAKVTQADIACSNGVIHVIDSVLIPN